jgi:eukaryotic-like serine/threonine-protein kinase
MATQTQSFLQGEVVDGKYSLLRYLGGSEHSAVFLTEYGSARPKEAAIKLLPAPPGNAESQLSCWRMSANLSHPNLMRILDMGRCQMGNASMLYLVTELAGENLADILPQRPLTPEEAREMLASMLDLLSFMHSRGFVHGHIKPSNIMAVGEQLKLSSDRICRLGDAVESNGTISTYDPPEDLRGGASRKADIWSLGMTLVEVLTQHLPEWSRSDRRDPVPPETMPAPFAEIARHCLRRDPKNRWSAATIQSHLPRSVTASALSPARAIARVAERAPQARRYAMWGAAGVAALLVVFAGVKFGGRHAASVDSQTAAPVAANQQPAGPAATDPRPAEARGSSAKAEGAPLAPERAAKKPERTEPTRRAETERRVTGPAVTVAPIARSSAPAKVAPVRSAPAAASVAPSSPASAATAPARAPNGDAVAGRVLQRVMPDVPKKASNTIWGTVRVGVRAFVDASGNVTQAEIQSEGPSRYFARLSVEAARKWHFAPPTENGQAVASVWLLHFGYRHDGMGVEPEQTTP